MEIVSLSRRLNELNSCPRLTIALLQGLLSNQECFRSPSANKPLWGHCALLSIYLVVWHNQPLPTLLDLCLLLTGWMIIGCRILCSKDVRELDRVWQQPNSNNEGWLTYAKIIFQVENKHMCGWSSFDSWASSRTAKLIDFHSTLQSTFNPVHSIPHWPVVVPYPEQLGPLFLFSVFRL